MIEAPRYHTRMQRPLLARARRYTPDPLVRGLIAVRTRRGLADPAMLDRGRREMRFVLGDDAPDAEVEAAARRYVEQWFTRAELRWRPRMMLMPVRGIERLEGARAIGRGVVLNFSHHGHYEAAIGSVGLAGVRQVTINDTKYLRDDCPDSRRQNLVLSELGGNRLEFTDIGYAGILGLVQAGEVVTLASDVAGTTPVRFLGRDLLGSSGAARIATTADAPVVVMTTRRDDRGQRYVHLGEPLLPADFATVEDLLAAMLAQHEEAVRAWPEAYDSPLSRWGQPT
ncbi:LpxL/LpxP family acyltransferase [Nocardioides dilutus]